MSSEAKKKIAVIIGLLFFMAILGQILGSILFLRFTPLETYSTGIFTLLRLYIDTDGQVMALSSYKWSFIGSLFPIVLVLLILLMALLRGSKRELHGSASFATPHDVQKAGLLETKGSDPSILIGQYRGKYLQFFGKQFVLLAAPTRSGKGVGVVIPNCLHYSDSLVVMDIKLENFQLTAGYRQASGQKVYLLNLSTKDLKSHGWNPLSYIDRDAIFAPSQAQKIASIIYETSGSDNGTSRFFNEMAQQLFTGLALYMVETEHKTKLPTTITRLVQLTSPPNQTLKEWIIQVCDPINGESLSESCKSGLMSYANNADQTASGIISSLLSPLTVFSDPIVSAITSRNDFDLRDVRKKKMTIYVGVAPNDLARFERILNLFFSQLLSANLDLLPEQTANLADDDPNKLRYQCLLLLDEFAAIGKLGVIEKGSAFIAGFNMRILAIYQNQAQLNRNYTKDGAISLTSNFECQIMYPTRINDDAKEYSDMLGYETYKSRSTNRGTGQLISNSTSISDQKRALLLPQEIMVMPTTDCIVRLTGVPAIYAKKIVYYKDPVFKPRLMGYESIKVPDLQLKKVEISSTALTDEEKELMNNLTETQQTIIQSLAAMLNFKTSTTEQIEALRQPVANSYGALGIKLFDILLKMNRQVLNT